MPPCKFESRTYEVENANGLGVYRIVARVVRGSFCRQLKDIVFKEGIVTDNFSINAPTNLKGQIVEIVGIV